MKKYNVLIVDDEIHAVRGIIAGMNWDNLNINDLYTAHNKKQAQDIFMQHRIDLLVSDIDMPKGSGIELLTWVREKYPDTEAIFVSAHSDFMYAKQAMHLKTLNYLLKPIDYKELTDEIQLAFKKIETNREHNYVEESYLHLKKAHRSNQKETFWHHLYNHLTDISDIGIEKYSEKYDMKFTEKQYFYPILLYIENPDVELERINKKVSEKLKKHDVRINIVQVAANDFLCMVQKEQKRMNEQKVIEICEQIIREGKGDICLYLGGQTRISQLTSLLNQLKQLGHNNLMYKNKIIHLDEYHEKDYVPLIPKEAWIEQMQIGDKEKFFDEIRTMISSWEIEEQHVTRQSVRLFYQDFLQIVFYLLQTKGLEANTVFSNQVLLNELENIHHLDEFKEQVLFISAVVMEQLQPQSDQDSVVNQVKRFIESNISNHSLTRDDIAHHVFLNPDYLTRIFKKQTGKSASAYLQQVRMEKAAQLLAHTDLTISSISLECGYANFSYFSTLFKNYMHMNPKEYRKIHSKND